MHSVYGSEDETFITYKAPNLGILVVLERFLVGPVESNFGILLLRPKDLGFLTNLWMATLLLPQVPLHSLIVRVKGCPGHLISY